MSLSPRLARPGPGPCPNLTLSLSLWVCLCESEFVRCCVHFQYAQMRPPPSATTAVRGMGEGLILPVLPPGPLLSSLLHFLSCFVNSSAQMFLFFTSVFVFEFLSFFVFFVCFSYFSYFMFHCFYTQCRSTESVFHHKFHYNIRTLESF